MPEPFSKRYGYSLPTKVGVRDDAPPEVRSAIVFVCSELGTCLLPWQVQKAICDVQKRIVPAPTGGAVTWTDVQEMLMACDWTQVYDAVERVDQLLRAEQWYQKSAESFEHQINGLFIDHGIGWKLEEGELKVRGEEEFEFVSRRAREELALANKSVAEHEMAEVVRSLSRRPDPNITGAIRHAIAALEAYCRDELGDPNANVTTRIVELKLPKPLDEALLKLWAYANDQARHMRDSNNPGNAEAELVVSVAAAAIVYISARKRLG